MGQFYRASDAMREVEFDAMAAFGAQGWAVSVRF